MIICFDHLLTEDGVLQNHAINISKGRIASIQVQDQVDWSYAPRYAYGSAGFVDIQVNGGGGILFNASTNADDLVHMYKAHQQFGTTNMLATFITDKFEQMQNAAEAVSNVRKSTKLHNNAIAGIHFEGPWIDTAKRGVHESQYIRSPSQAELDLLRRSDLGQVKVTLAPEHIKPEIITELVQDNIVVFLGHSNATYQQTRQAIEAGASGFTHLYNAMSPMLSRSPGMVGAALSCTNTYAGIIADGHHVDAPCLQAAINAKGIHKIALVTDAMALAASEQSSASFFSQTISKKDNKLTIADGTLAGSCLSMFEAVSNINKMCKVSFMDALYMASTTAAKAVKQEHKFGKIATGMPANILGFSAEKTLEAIYCEGKNIEFL